MHDSGGKPWLMRLTRTDFGWASKTSNDWRPTYQFPLKAASSD